MYEGSKRGKNVLPAGSAGKSDVIQFTVKVIVASDWMIDKAFTLIGQNQLELSKCKSQQASTIHS